MFYDKLCAAQCISPTQQGYRTVSKKVWVVGNTSRDGDLIMNLVDPEADEEGEERVLPLMGLYDLVEAVGDEKR